MESMGNASFDIAFLDHVALRVEDLEISIKWYEKVLGLKRYQLEAWGAFPVFLLSGKSGVALFPANVEDPQLPKDSKNVKIDHFAFHVTGENFKKAKEKYDQLQLDYTVSDHHYYHSLYTKDPDGHIVELTTLVVDAADFYK